MPANDPMTAWVLQVYLRDFGLYLWTGPSTHIYGGFAAYVARRGTLVLTETHHADTIQEAATAATTEALSLVGRDLSEFPAWRERWEARACIDEEEAPNA